jgi:hypothetical protein
MPKTAELTTKPCHISAVAEKPQVSTISWSRTRNRELKQGAHEEVERTRPETVAWPDRLQPAYQKVLK